MLRIAILVIFVPLSVLLFFAWLKVRRSETADNPGNEGFIVRLPSVIVGLGIAGNLGVTVIVVGFTLFSEKVPHAIFYVVFGLGAWLYWYLILKSLRFRVIVKGDDITVHSILARPHSFTFDEIVSAVRQVKKNRVKSERVVIKTRSGKKLIVETPEISYRRFVNQIITKVPGEYLHGFGNFQGTLG